MTFVLAFDPLSATDYLSSFGTIGILAVVLGATMLGEGGLRAPGVVAGLVGFAVLALSAAVPLSQRHPAEQTAPA